MYRLLDVERQSKRLIVFAPDPDSIVGANDVDIACFFRESHRIRKQAKVILYLRVGSQRREARLLLHCIAESIILQEILPGVHPEIQKAAEDDELDQTPKPARSALSTGR